MYYFIVNPNSRSGKGALIWQGLEGILNERNVKYKTFFVVRLALILIFGISAIIFSHKIWLNNTVHIWNFICTYCLVAILTLMQGGDYYEENGKG
mgnify:CR=1 FL=1